MTAAEAGAAGLQLPGGSGASGQSPATEEPRSIRRAIIRIARVVFTAAVVCAVTYATVTEWSSVRSYITNLAWPLMLLALLMVVVGIGATTLGWRAALRYAGHQVALHSAAQIYVVGLMAKYLPGSAWAFLLQMELGKRAKLPRLAAFLASVIVAGLAATTAAVLGLFAVPALMSENMILAVAALALVPVSLVAACPPVLTWLLRRVAVILRKKVEIPALTWRAEWPVVGWSLVTWAVFGFHLWLLANSVGAPGLGGYFLCVGAVALGQTVGLLAFLAPSGMGVREAVIVAVLAPSTSVGTALGIALTSRLIFTIGDVLSAGAAAAGAVAVPRLQARRDRRRGAAGGAFADRHNADLRP